MISPCDGYILSLANSVRMSPADYHAQAVTILKVSDFIYDFKRQCETEILFSYVAFSKSLQRCNVTLQYCLMLRRVRRGALKCKASFIHETQIILSICRLKHDV